MLRLCTERHVTLLQLVQASSQACCDAHRTWRLLHRGCCRSWRAYDDIAWWLVLLLWSGCHFGSATGESTYTLPGTSVVGRTSLAVPQRCLTLPDCRAARQASGSGGTAGGIALGLHLAGHADVRVHAFGVCDDPDYFYDYIDSLYADMGATPAAVGELHCSGILIACVSTLPRPEPH